MPPADQRFEALDALARQADLGLVVDRELTTFEPSAKVAFKHQAIGSARHHVVGESNRLCLAGALGFVHRDVCPLRHLLGVEIVELRYHTDTGGNEHF